MTEDLIKKLKDVKQALVSKDMTGEEFMVQRSGTGMDRGRGENGKSLDTVQCVSIFNTMPGPDYRRNCVDRVYEKR